MTFHHTFGNLKRNSLSSQKNPTLTYIQKKINVKNAKITKTGYNLKLKPGKWHLCGYKNIHHDILYIIKPCSKPF